MDLNKLCTSCLNDKGDSISCSLCGWTETGETESPQHLAPRTILHGKYMLGRVLGQGGFGITYLAWDINLNRKVAIKEYLPRDFASRSPDETVVSVFSGNSKIYFEEGLEKFLEEARTLARFDGHPNIVSIRDFFRANGTAYLVMTYLEGITLKEFLQQQNSRLDFPTALSIMMPVMDALSEVHKVGVLHRDISPDNIFITQSKIVKVLDFGAARHALGEHSKSLSVILKPGYAPEEQYRSRGQQGAWTDVYAVAATLYRIICGQIPPESLDRLHEESLMPPSQLNINIPEYAEKALLTALSVRHDQRFQNMRDFQNALSGSQDYAIASSASIAPSFEQVSSVGSQLSSCKKCGSALNPGQNFCTSCGTRSDVSSISIQNEKQSASQFNKEFCSSCGTVIQGKHSFCTSCGKSLGDNSSTNNSSVYQSSKQEQQNQTPASGGAYVYNEPIRHKKANKGLIGCLVVFATLAVLIFVFLIWLGLQTEDDPATSSTTPVSIEFGRDIDKENLTLTNISDTFYADEEFYFLYYNINPFNTDSVNVKLINTYDNTVLLEHDYSVDPSWNTLYDSIGFTHPGKYKVDIMIKNNIVASKEVNIN